MGSDGGYTPLGAFGRHKRHEKLTLVAGILAAAAVRENIKFLTVKGEGGEEETIGIHSDAPIEEVIEKITFLLPEGASIYEADPPEDPDEILANAKEVSDTFMSGEGLRKMIEAHDPPDMIELSFYEGSREERDNTRSGWERPGKKGGRQRRRGRFHS